MNVSSALSGTTALQQGVSMYGPRNTRQPTFCSDSGSPYRLRCVRAIVVSAFAVAACSDATTPAELAYDNPAGTHTAQAVAVAGSGTGGVSVTPRAVPEGYFVADIKVRIRRAVPNTTYLIQRAPEVGRASSSNGICERALGISPWSSSDAPAPAFITFVPSGSTAPVTLVTNAAGDGSTDFEFRAPTIPAGTKFDVMFRLINDAVAPTALVMSQCFTVTVL